MGDHDLVLEDAPPSAAASSQVQGAAAGAIEAGEEGNSIVKGDLEARKTWHGAAL